MLMIPITYFPATGLVLTAIWIRLRVYDHCAMPWLLAFLCSLALQLFLLGARYGYGVDAVLNIQHLTGVLIPPLAYLAFANPSVSAGVLVHGLPVLAIGLGVYVSTPLLDTLLAFITLGYAAALLIVLQREGDGLFSWAPLSYVTKLRMALLASVAALVLSGTTDAIIAFDVWATGGIQIDSIVAVASIGGVALLTICSVLLVRLGASQQPASSTSSDQALVEKLTAEIVQIELFRDPDLTLSRLARRLALPAREISQAVNRGTGLNMSQFINNMRIKAACKMLETTDFSITNAMLEAGFYTKSNFNREFRRVMGQTPSEWRRAIKPSRTATSDTTRLPQRPDA